MTDPNQSIVDPVANNLQPAKTEDDDKKVFAGNLAFATTEQELKSLFSEAGKVTHAQIITRGTRSLGYGFVTFSTDTEAQTAIQLLNKRDVGGREISVESAKPQAEGAAEDDAAKAATNGDDASHANGTKPSKSAKRRQKKKGFCRRRLRRRCYQRRVFHTQAKPESSEPKPRAPRAKRAFSDYKVKSAHVVKRRSGNRSKGFGFVDFEDASEQQRAIASAQGKQIDGRDVTSRLPSRTTSPRLLLTPRLPDHRCLISMLYMAFRFHVRGLHGSLCAPSCKFYIHIRLTGRSPKM
ncbi:uncharacterized protein UTRI_05607 [Ustilago trichophora]|uniref:RRM domain-containing protein n=1 Tax=Ustilago trichophora TaxID=86804 RepID=A0A5C3EEH1_9BASI|nr:uncharacterized protein UTRI_05607 [Ustilago trichophora]